MDSTGKIVFDPNYNDEFLLDIENHYTKNCKNCFIPRPNVDSVILSLEKRKDKPNVKDENLLFRLIKDSFRFKRKNLRNNLKEYDLLKIEEILKKYNKDLTSRAETLDLEVFIDIANNI